MNKVDKHGFIYEFNFLSWSFDHGVNIEIFYTFYYLLVLCDTNTWPPALLSLAGLFLSVAWRLLRCGRIEGRKALGTVILNPRHEVIEIFP